MPTYHYECPACNNTFDLFQSMSASTTQPCPECKGDSVRQMGAGSGVIYKGAGFYLTDYKNNKPAGGAPTPAAGATPAAAPAAPSASPASSPTSSSSAPAPSTVPKAAPAAPASTPSAKPAAAT